MTDTTTSRSPPERDTRRLERRRDGRIFAGVAAGISDRYDIGVGWVRFGFIIGLFFGMGVPAYILAWLLIPVEGEADSVATRYLGRLEGASTWIGAALIGIAVLIIVGDITFIRSELIWAGALVLVGVLLYRGDLDSATRRDAPASTRPDSPQPPASSVAVDDGVAGAREGPEQTAGVGGGRMEPPPIAAFEPAPRRPSGPRRRPPSVLGRVTVAVILIAVGLVWLLERADLLSPEPTHYAAVILGISGVGLLVGTWFGRARGLIALGIMVLPFFVFLSLVDVPWGSGWGERDFRPATVAELPSEYRLAGGELFIDLRSLDFGDREEIEVDAHLGFGGMRVIVARDVSVVVDTEVVAGEINLLGDITAGVSIDRSVATRNGTKVLVLDLRVGFGELRVTRAGN